MFTLQSTDTDQRRARNRGLAGRFQVQFLILDIKKRWIRKRKKFVKLIKYVLWILRYDQTKL